MKFKIIAVLILLNFQNSTFAQEPKEESSWIVKLNTTALIDIFSFPTVQFAIEKKFNNSFSVQTEMGYQLYNVRNVDTASVKEGGYRLNVEGRFYPFSHFKKDKTKKRFSDGIYTGLQAFYRENKYNAETNYYKSEYDYENPETATSFVDNYGVIKKASGVNLALGFQKRFHKFVVEPHMYLGLIHKKVRNKDLEYNNNLGHFPDNGPHDYFRELDFESSSGTYFNFAVGLRLGYCF